MSQTSEKKNRFQVSSEVEEEFVNSIAEKMLALSETAGKWKQGWSGGQMGMPYCPVTGREYSGANMMHLFLTSILNGYADDRWMTFKQLQSVQSENPDMQMNIRKGEKGTKVLRPENIYFTIDEDGKWHFLGKKELEQLRATQDEGKEIPQIHSKTLFYPFTVFNASQIDGFPPKENPGQSMTEVERNEFVERFIACSGIAVEHLTGTGPLYSHTEDTVKLPFPDTFISTDEYYAAKLHEVFHATGHESRENRQRKNGSNLKTYAFEEMRAELFSMLAGAKFALPMPESNSAAYIEHWNQKFSGGDAKAVFQAAAEAAKMLTVMHQFEMGEKPKPDWFPAKEAWPELIEMQKQRDIATGVSYRQQASGTQIFEHIPRKPAPSLEASKAAFDETDDLALKARLILQNPSFLDMALKQDPEAMRDLAQLCDQMATMLHMEADEKLRQGEIVPDALMPVPEPKTAPARRMRA